MNIFYIYSNNKQYKITYDKVYNKLYYIIDVSDNYNYINILHN
jgi:hypothetical protein